MLLQLSAGITHWTDGIERTPDADDLRLLLFKCPVNYA